MKSMNTFDMKKHEDSIFSNDGNDNNNNNDIDLQNKKGEQVVVATDSNKECIKSDN